MTAQSSFRTMLQQPAARIAAVLAVLAVALITVLMATSLSGGGSGTAAAAVPPTPELDWAEPREVPLEWMQRHESFVAAAEAARQGAGLELVWYGDSITESFHSTSMGRPKHLGVKEVFQEKWGSRYRTDAFAISGDLTTHLAWRLLHGEGLEGLNARVAVVMIGINDLGTALNTGSDPDEAARTVADHIRGILELLLSQDAGVHVVVQGILPAGGGGHDGRFSQPSAVTQYVDYVNSELEKFCTAGSYASRLTYAYCARVFLTQDGKALREELMPDALHPNAEGHAAMADCLKPTIDPLLQ